MTITANYIEAGDIIKIGKKLIQTTSVQIHCGAFGEYVLVDGIDTKTDNYIRPVKFEWETMVEKV